MAKKRNGGPPMKNRMGDVPNEGELSKVNGAAPGPQRIPGTAADWLAAQNHELRADNCDLRDKVMDRDGIIIKKDQLILTLRQKLHQLEVEKSQRERKTAETTNAKLRETHGLILGRSIHRDDTTGDVYFTVDESK